MARSPPLESAMPRYTLKPAAGVDLAGVPGWQRTSPSAPATKATSAPAALPATRHKPVDQMSEAEMAAEIAEWDRLEKSGQLVQQKPVERQSAPPTRKGVVCIVRHEPPLRRSDLTGREREVEMLVKATAAAEL